MENLVSILIPCYNKAEFLTETLESVLNQIYTHWECILVNDGSTDDTERIAKSFCEKDNRFRYFLKKNEGVSSARNFGIQKARGDFFIFLDSDDILADFSLSKRLAFFRQYPEQDGIVFSTHFFEYDAQNPGLLFNSDPEIESEANYLSLFLNYRFAWQTMSPIWRRKVIEKVAFRTDLRLLEDVVFHIEILFLEGIKIKRVHLVDNYYRVLPTKTHAIPGKATEMSKSVLFLIHEYNDKISKDESLKLLFKRFVKIVYRIVIVDAIPSKKGKELYEIALKQGYISTKEKGLFWILSCIYNLKLDTKKNIGMYRILSTIDKMLLK